MAEKPDDTMKPIGDPPEKKKVRTEDEKAPPAGEGEAANDAPGKPGEDEETMPIEEGFSIVP